MKSKFKSVGIAALLLVGFLPTSAVAEMEGIGCASSGNWQSGNYHYFRYTDYYGETTLMVEGPNGYTHYYYYDSGCNP